MRILFLGSGELACPCLDRLLAESADAVVGLVCQPDRPRGRALRPAPCAARVHAEARGIPVLTPEDVNAPESLAALRALAPDLAVVAAYGQFLKPALLALPARGCINVHPSLLPKYRGAAPVQWAIARGETETGVTILVVGERMDAGDIIAQQPEPIAPDDTAAPLLERLARRGADLLAETLAAFRRGPVRGRPQDEAAATRAPRLRKQDGRLDWALPAAELRNRVRGFDPWPGGWCRLPPSGLVRVWAARVESGRPGAPPGALLEAAGDGPLVQAGVGALRLIEVQPEGRRRMAGDEFLRGRRLGPAAE